jgi:hypothetical protein
MRRLIAELPDADGDDEPSEVTLVTGGQRVRFRAQQGSRPEIELDPVTVSPNKRHDHRRQATIAAALLAIAGAITALVEVVRQALGK